MTKHRVSRRNQKHPGVRVFVRSNGTAIARWNDPLSGALAQQSLDRLGLTNKQQRTDWAVAKSAELADLRKAVSLGSVTKVRQGVREATDEYLAGVGKASTRKIKSSVLHAFAEWCDLAKIRSVQAIVGPKLMRWRDHVLAPGSGRMLSTSNRWLVTTGIFLRWSVDRGLAPMLNSDIIRRACGRAAEPGREIDFLRPPQLRKVLEVAMAQDAAEPGCVQQVAPFLLALLLTGCRVAEMLHLEWSEIDFDAKEIRLPAAKTKTSRPRTITMRECPALLTLLEALRDRAGDRRHVFAWPSYDVWKKRCGRVATAAGIKFTAHGMRRTCGTLLTCAPSIYGGASAFLSAKRLGHGVDVAERLYAGVLRDLPADAKTIEAAAGIEPLCEQIIAAAG